MSLFSRIEPTAPDKISVHQLYAAMVEHIRGQLTGAQVKAGFSLNASESTEMQAIINQLNAQSNNAAKALYLEGIHAVWILVESGEYTEAKAKTSLGF